MRGEHWLYIENLSFWLENYYVVRLNLGMQISVIYALDDRAILGLIIKKWPITALNKT